MIDYNITVKEQPTKTIVKVAPTQEWLTDNNYTVDSAEYIEYSYTGKQEDIIQQRDIELAKAGSSYQISTTITRGNGDVWTLNVRQSDLKKEETEVTPEEAEFGSKDNPKQLSINITAIQESVLNHAKYATLTDQQRGAIKAYMNGALDGQKVADSSGKAIRLGSIYAYSEPLTQLALKCPTYYVPSISVTFQYYSSSPVTDIAQIGTQKAPPANFGKLPDGYISLFMGCSSSPQGKGYVVQENYTIGKFNTELYSNNTTE